MAARVFVTQFARQLDFSELAKWGEVRFLTEREYVPEPSPPTANESVVDEITRNFSDYIPGIDLIVTTGSALPNMIVGGLINKMKGNRILKWSNRDHKYELYVI